MLQARKVDEAKAWGIDLEELSLAWVWELFLVLTNSYVIENRVVFNK